MKKGSNYQPIFKNTLYISRYVLSNAENVWLNKSRSYSYGLQTSMFWTASNTVFMYILVQCPSYFEKFIYILTSGGNVPFNYENRQCLAPSSGHLCAKLFDSFLLAFWASLSELQSLQESGPINCTESFKPFARHLTFSSNHKYRSITSKISTLSCLSPE